MFQKPGVTFNLLLMFAAMFFGTVTGVGLFKWRESFAYQTRRCKAVCSPYPGQWLVAKKHCLCVLGDNFLKEKRNGKKKEKRSRRGDPGNS